MEYGFVCPKCRRHWTEGDRFCRFCGTPVTSPDYIEAPPPVMRTHECVLCGFKWGNWQVEDLERFCPQCGGNAPVIAVEELPPPIPPTLIWEEEDDFNEI